jgi:peptidylprolyl isomerase
MPLARRSLSLFLLSTALVAAAQTATHPKARTTTPVKSTQPALPKNIPAVSAPMKTQYVMRYQEIKVGTGDLAEPGWIYSVHYTGWLASDGTKFDSSLDRGQPIQFQQGIKRVITGWDQGFEGMHVGGKRRLFIPYQLAYGEKGRAAIPPKADLIFDVELVDQLNPSAPPPPPQPPAQPAAPAQPNAPSQPQTPPQPPTSQNQ